MSLFANYVLYGSRIMKILFSKCMMLIMFGISSFHSLAVGSYTTIENNKVIYSEYYPNYKAKFRGTIVFENGSGMALTQWTKFNKFFSCAKKQGSLFFYDRNGLGNSKADLSTSTTNPITADLVTKKLLKLLEQRRLPKPYIIVGHSYGGVYADYFARRYPDVIKGVLLVDPSPQNLQYSQSHMKQQAYLESWVNVPNQVLYKQYTYQLMKKTNFTIPAAEVFYSIQGIEKTREQISKLPPLPNNIPIIVLSSTQMESSGVMALGWFKEQKRYLNNNLYSKALMIEASHTIWDKEPELVCEQIKNLVLSRNGLSSNFRNGK